MSAPEPAPEPAPLPAASSGMSSRTRNRLIRAAIAVAVVVGIRFAFSSGGLSPADQALNNWLNKYQHPDSSAIYSDTTKLTIAMEHPNVAAMTTLCTKGLDDFRRFAAQPLPPDPPMRAPWTGFNASGLAIFSDCLELTHVSSSAQVNTIAGALNHQVHRLIGFQDQLNAVARARGLSVSSTGATD